ncbi:Retrovirus-related Pol polyprotein like [Argiope bruennichi]|uniref:Retrovirus-related Pol polyprotein like n=1 Tax=Argiope bruennichi TaxID=94029 RepID=A0A8T0F070_ARGBR|nr:Retrovirus-related Pol polyprotein like [Argiope bruennichi]
MTPHKELIDDYTKPNVKLIKTGSSVIEVEGVGNVTFLLSRNGEKVHVTFSNVLHVPKLTANLLSIKYLNKTFGMVSTFTGERCLVYKNKHLVASGTGVGDNLYSLDISSEWALITHNISNDLLHKRVGHLSKAGMTKLKDMVEGFTFNGELPDCTSCIKGKMHKLRFSKGKAKRAKDILGIVHTDICGPMNSHVEKQTGRSIKVLRSDNGTEYINNEMMKYLELKGIQHQKSIPYTPEQMGVAERNNRTLVERARSMLTDAHLDKKYWAEAVQTANHCKNVSPTVAVTGMTPYEKWSGDKPNLEYLRVFGCRAFVHIPKEKRTKWDAKAREMMFIGYCQDRKGYRLIDPVTNEIINARDVHFLENQMYNLMNDGKPKFYDDSLFSGSISNSSDNETNNDSNNETESLRNDNAETDLPDNVVSHSDDAIDNNTNIDNSVDNSLPVLTRPYRETKIPNRYQDFDMNGMPDLQMPNLNRMCYVKALAAMINDCCLEPKTIEEALNGPDGNHWRDSITETILGHIKNKTWEIVDQPNNKNIVNCKWVFKIKKNSKGEIERYKSRLVAKGFSQIEGIDYNETFSPVVRYVTLRVLLAYAAIYDWEIDQMDAVMAFVQGTLDEEIYMKIPEGFNEYYGKNHEKKVLKLNKALDGLKQSGRLCNSVKLKNWVKDELKRRFEMKDLGTANYCLGIKIERDRKNGSISLNQTQYLESMLRKYCMHESHPVATPLDCNSSLNKFTNSNVDMRKIPFQAAVGSLLYAAQATRPDISFAVNLMCQFCNSPSKTHWIAIKRIMRYLRGTTGATLSYTKDHGDNVIGYCDSNYGGDVADRRSTSGYVFMIGGGAVSWSSKRQPTVATSTTEAEYMALSAAAKEAIWLGKIVTDLGIAHANGITVYCDNNGAINLSKNNMYHTRSKHIDIQHHFVREVIKSGQITVERMPTAKMIADFLTKTVPRAKHELCAQSVGLTL